MQNVMKKSLAVLLAAGTITAASMTISTPAEAHWRGYRGGAIAAGVIGGLALGAIAGGAYYGGPYYGYGYRRAYYGGPYYGGYYRPAYYYGAEPYYASARYYGPRCYTQRRWVSTYYGDRLRRVRVCY